MNASRNSIKYIENQLRLRNINRTYTTINRTYTSDGGFRGPDASSGAWIVCQVRLLERRAVPVCVGHTFFRGGQSAFQAEVVALEAEIDACVKLVT